MSGDKKRFPRALALLVARELCAALEEAAERLIVAGSLRRGKADVGDVEILYVPRTGTRAKADDFFASEKFNAVDDALARLEKAGILARRLNTLGRPSYGPKNKLMIHLATGLPVDLFSATPANWWNYLVCRTGPAESNVRIATAAEKRGWKWNTYGAGFSRDGEIHAVKSEEEVFAFVGLPYAEPRART